MKARGGKPKLSSTGACDDVDVWGLILHGIALFQIAPYAIPSILTLPCQIQLGIRRGTRSHRFLHGED